MRFATLLRQIDSLQQTFLKLDPRHPDSALTLDTDVALTGHAREHQ